MERRIKGAKSVIDYSATSEFFAGRATKYSAQAPYVATSYQDNAPDLAMARDSHEKELIMPILKIDVSSRVIDIGCGVGRWADSVIPLAGVYLGLDFCPELIQVANSRFMGCGHACDSRLSPALCAGERRSGSERDDKKTSSDIVTEVSQAKVKSEEVSEWTAIVYHTRNGTASTI